MPTLPLADAIQQDCDAVAKQSAAVVTSAAQRLLKSSAPTIHCEVRLKSGEILQGDVPFQCRPRGKRWIGQGGIDWHLPVPSGKEAKKSFGCRRSDFHDGADAV
jgi:hypothetical protein